MIYSSLPHGKALCVLEHGDISHIGIMPDVQVSISNQTFPMFSELS